MHFFPHIAIKVYTWYITYISFRKNKGPKRDHFHFSLFSVFTFTSQLGGRRSIAWEGLRTVRARLAIFWLEILLKMKSMKISNFGSKLLPEIGYFWNLFWKIHIPIRNLNFLRATLQHFQNIKPIRKLLCTISSCSDKCIYMIYNIYKFQEK